MTDTTLETACQSALQNDDLLAADALIRLIALNGRETL
jgi:hypothetical protein